MSMFQITDLTFKLIFIVILMFMPLASTFGQTNPDELGSDPRYLKIRTQLEDFSGVYLYRSRRPFIKNPSRNLFPNTNDAFYDEETLRFGYNDRVLMIEPLPDIPPIPFKLEDGQISDLDDDMRRNILRFKSDTFAFTLPKKNNSRISYEYIIHLTLDFSEAPQKITMTKVYDVTVIEPQKNSDPKRFDFTNEEDGSLTKTSTPPAVQILPSDLIDKEWLIKAPDNDPLEVLIRFGLMNKNQTRLKLEINSGQGYEPFNNLLNRNDRPSYIEASLLFQSSLTFHFFKEHFLYQFVIFFDRDASGQIQGHGEYRMIDGQLNFPDQTFEMQGQAVMKATRCHPIVVQVTSNKKL